MTTPEIKTIVPASSASAVPLGSNISIAFNSSLDLSTVKNNIVIFGKDFDKTSGPESATWINDRKGTNPFFLRSPGFKGIVECNYELVYITIDEDGVEVAEVDPASVPDEDTETDNDYAHKVLVKPKVILSPDSTYTVYVIGEGESGTDFGISRRTVYDVEAGGSNTSTTGLVHVFGGYTGATNDIINVTITESGNIGTAEFKWWYDSENEADAREDKVTSRRFRRLEDGVQLRFSGSSFVADDTFTIKVYAPDYLATSYSYTFDTATSGIETVPSSASTSVIGDADDTATSSTYLKLSSTSPIDGASNQAFSSRQITINFSAALDSETVTDSTITVLAYPISGVYEGTNQAKELVKKLTVSGKKLTIDL